MEVVIKKSTHGRKNDSRGHTCNSDLRRLYWVDLPRRELAYALNSSPFRIFDPDVECADVAMKQNRVEKDKDREEMDCMPSADAEQNKVNLVGRPRRPRPRTPA